MSSAAGPIDSETGEVKVAPKATEVRARGTGSVKAARTYVVRIGYREPEYARCRGIEAHTYSGEFRVVASSVAHAIDMAMDAFREAAAQSSVSWRREVCSVSCSLTE